MTTEGVPITVSGVAIQEGGGGESCVVVEGEPRSPAATTVADCFVLRIDEEDFQELLSTHDSAFLILLCDFYREWIPVIVGRFLRDRENLREVRENLWG
jgi:CRP-like cAMP-binding protein